MLFLFKKLVAPLFYPLSLCLLLLLTGLILLWLTRRQKAGKIVASVGTALLFLFSYGFLTDRLLRSLERKFPPVAAESLQEGGIRWVVVLGGGASSDPEVPSASRLSESSLAHLIEGIRLHRHLPTSRIILSGGKVFGTGSDADAMRDLAIQLGVPPENLISESSSPDTETQAQNVRELVGSDAFFVGYITLPYAARNGTIQESGDEPHSRADTLSVACESVVKSDRLVSEFARTEEVGDRYLRVSESLMGEDQGKVLGPKEGVMGCDTFWDAREPDLVKQRRASMFIQSWAEQHRLRYITYNGPIEGFFLDFTNLNKIPTVSLRTTLDLLGVAIEGLREFSFVFNNSADVKPSRRNRLVSVSMIDNFEGDNSYLQRYFDVGRYNASEKYGVYREGGQTRVIGQSSLFNFFYVVKRRYLQGLEVSDDYKIFEAIWTR